jgi:hypothetical protein
MNHACTDECDELLPLDESECPHCGQPHGIHLIYDGDVQHCDACRRPIVAVACTDVMILLPVVRGPWRLSGRKRTRALWRRRGRR